MLGFMTRESENFDGIFYRNEDGEELNDTYR